MSKYTTEVRYICETQAGLDTSQGYESINDIISKARPKIFDFDYPIFDTAYKPVLETKILKHFYTREIGLETYGLWKLKLDTRLNEIMPFYNQLYIDGLNNIDPFLPINLNKEYSKNGEASTEETAENEVTENTTGSNTKTDAMTGTVGDAKDTTNTRTDNLTETSTNTRTDNLSETTSNTRTDNLKEEVDETRTPNITKATTEGGTEGVSKTSALKNTRYDIYSDTPQGGLTGVNAENYLTNARKIIDDGTGSTEGSTTTFGKTINERETGTEAISRETDNTGTQQNSGSKANTGTQQNSGSKTNTGTQTDREQGSNTRTYNTLDTINGSNTESKTTEGNSTKTNSGTTIETYLENLKGRNGNIDFFDIAQKIRECILNIDMMIIDDLECLFMHLW